MAKQKLELDRGLKPTVAEPAVWYYGPWESLEEAKEKVPVGIRHDGLRVMITGGGEYWWRSDNLTDSGLKPVGGSIVSKGYLLVDTGAETSIGERNTNKPFSNLDAALAAYQPGDILLIEKVDQDTQLFSGDLDLHIRFKDERKVLRGKCASLENEAANSISRIDGWGTLESENGPWDVILNSEQSDNYFSDIFLRLKKIIGNIELGSAVADIELLESTGNVVFAYKPFRGVTGVEKKLRFKFHNHVDHGATLDSVNHRIIYVKESPIEDESLKGIIQYEGKCSRTHEEAPAAMDAAFILTSHVILKDFRLIDTGNTIGSFVMSGELSSAIVEVEGVAMIENNSPYWHVDTSDTINYTGYGILIHNGEIIYDGVKERLKDYFESFVINQTPKVYEMFRSVLIDVPAITGAGKTRFSSLPLPRGMLDAVTIVLRAKLSEGSTATIGMGIHGQDGIKIAESILTIDENTPTGMLVFPIDITIGSAGVFFVSTSVLNADEDVNIAGTTSGIGDRNISGICFNPGEVPVNLFGGASYANDNVVYSALTY